MGGEETTMIEIIKGRPMKAQQRPPYPTQFGVFDKPTAVQNVETLAQLPWIVGRGAASFTAVGAKATPGYEEQYDESGTRQNHSGSPPGVAFAPTAVKLCRATP